MKLRTAKQLLTVPFAEWSEAEWQKWVVDKAHKAGWHTIQFTPAMVHGRWITGTTNPWVDVVAIRGERMLLLELKREREWVWKPGQQPLMLRLQAVADANPGVEAYKVHPSEAMVLLRVLARERITTPGGNITSSPTSDQENHHE